MKFALPENIYAKNNNNEINKKKYKKHSMSPFCSLDAGNVDYNIAMFNKMNGIDTSSENNTSLDSSGATEMSVGEALELLNEAVTEDRVDSLIKEYIDVLDWLEDK